MISVNDPFGSIDVPVGEQVNYMNSVVEAYTSIDGSSGNCDGCFYEALDCDRVLLCNDFERIDKTMVKFKKVEPNE